MRRLTVWGRAAAAAAFLGAVASGDDRPVLMHEQMHVLEFRTIPSGFRNATVRRCFEEAQAGSLYPPES